MQLNFDSSAHSQHNIYIQFSCCLWFLWEKQMACVLVVVQRGFCNRRRIAYNIRTHNAFIEYVFCRRMFASVVWEMRCFVALLLNSCRLMHFWFLYSWDWWEWPFFVYISTLYDHQNKAVYYTHIFSNIIESGRSLMPYMIHTTYSIMYTIV